MRPTIRLAALGTALALIPGATATAAPPAPCVGTPLCEPVPTPGNDGRCRASGVFVDDTLVTPERRIGYSHAERDNGVVGTTSDDDVVQGADLYGAVSGSVKGVHTSCFVTWNGVNNPVICAWASVDEFALTVNNVSNNAIVGADLYTFACSDGYAESSIGSLVVTDPITGTHAVDVSRPPNTAITVLGVATLYVNEQLVDPAPGGPCPHLHAGALRIKTPATSVMVSFVSTAWCVLPM
jgi:hypothetical protein